jgi:hypothetical protein
VEAQQQIIEKLFTLTQLSSSAAEKKGIFYPHAIEFITSMVVIPV